MFFMVDDAQQPVFEAAGMEKPSSAGLERARKFRVDLDPTERHPKGHTDDLKFSVFQTKPPFVQSRLKTFLIFLAKIVKHPPCVGDCGPGHDSFVNSLPIPVAFNANFVPLRHNSPKQVGLRLANLTNHILPVSLFSFGCPSDGVLRA